MNNRDVKRYLVLIAKKRAHEEAIEGLADQLKALEGPIIDNMTAAGIQRVTLDGHTVYVDRKLWAGAEGGNTPALADALRKEGLDELVSEAVNATRLSAWVREFDPDKCLAPDDVRAKLPEQVRPVIRITETVKLGVRKA